MIDETKVQGGLHPLIALGYWPMLPHFSAQRTLPAGTPGLYWCWCPKTGSEPRALGSTSARLMENMHKGI